MGAVEGIGRYKNDDTGSEAWRNTYFKDVIHFDAELKCTST